MFSGGVRPLQAFLPLRPPYLDSLRLEPLNSAGFATWLCSLYSFTAISAGSYPNPARIHAVHIGENTIPTIHQPHLHFQNRPVIFPTTPPSFHPSSPSFLIFIASLMRLLMQVMKLILRMHHHRPLFLQRILLVSSACSASPIALLVRAPVLPVIF